MGVLLIANRDKCLEILLQAQEAVIGLEIEVSDPTSAVQWLHRVKREQGMDSAQIRLMKSGKIWITRGLVKNE